MIDFKASNLHVVSYSAPVRAVMPLEKLRPHPHTLPEIPNAVPYRTTYYDDNWAFCLSHRALESLADEQYEVVIDSELAGGSLTYADSLLPGASDREVFLTTYVCHPSMANNELSGPVVGAYLNRALSEITGRRYTYRFVFAPETIGALVYLSKHGEQMRGQMDAGFVITCCGDDGPFTYKRSRRGETLADRAAEHVVPYVAGDSEWIAHDFFPDGSDERQYCSPGFDLPVGSLMRSMYGTYSEYHTSKDDLTFISARGLASTLKAYLRVVQTIEMNGPYWSTNQHGEPQLGRRGLHPKLGAGTSTQPRSKRILYLLAYSDGKHDLIDIAERAGQPAWEFGPEIEALMAAGLLTRLKESGWEKGCSE